MDARVELRTECHDEKQQRIAQDLSDKINPALHGIASRFHALMQLTRNRDEQAAPALDETVALAESLERDMHDLAESLEYRVLEQVGLPGAIRWHAESFAKLNGVRMELDLPAEFGPLPRAFEIKVLRIVKDILGEIDLHSRSRVAEIRLISTSEDHRVASSDRAGEFAAEFRVSRKNNSLEMKLPWARMTGGQSAPGGKRGTSVGTAEGLRVAGEWRRKTRSGESGIPVEL